MAIELVQVRSKTSGAKTFLPETALAHFPDYVRTPSQRARDEVPDGTAFPADEISDDESAGTTTTATARASTPTKGN